MALPRRSHANETTRTNMLRSKASIIKLTENYPDELCIVVHQYYGNASNLSALAHAADNVINRNCNNRHANACIHKAFVCRIVHDTKQQSNNAMFADMFEETINDDKLSNIMFVENFR